jgi:hypothetical protein
MSEEFEENSAKFTYFPNYHSNTYDYSKKSSFKYLTNQVDYAKAKESLRILVSFLKEEIENAELMGGQEMAEANLQYEPLLS